MYSRVAAGACTLPTILLLVWITLALVGVNVVSGLGDDSAGRDSSSLLKLRQIETRLEKRAARQTSGSDAVGDNGSQTRDTWRLIRALRSSADRSQHDVRKRESADTEDGNSGQTWGDILSRQDRDTGPIDNFQQCYADFLNQLKPFVSSLRYKLVSGTPDVVLGVTQIPNLFPIDDISFAVRDSNKMVVKFSLIFQAMGVVNSKLITFIRDDSVSEYKQQLNMVMYLLKVANLASARLAFNQEDQISILSGGISGVNQSVRFGVDRAAMEAVFKCVQFLLTVSAG